MTVIHAFPSTASNSESYFRIQAPKPTLRYDFEGSSSRTQPQIDNDQSLITVQDFWEVLDFFQIILLFAACLFFIILTRKIYSQTSNLTKTIGTVLPQVNDEGIRYLDFSLPVHFRVLGEALQCSIHLFVFYPGAPTSHLPPSSAAYRSLYALRSSLSSIAVLEISRFPRDPEAATVAIKLSQIPTDCPTSVLYWEHLFWEHLSQVAKLKWK